MLVNSLENAQKCDFEKSNKVWEYLLANYTIIDVMKLVLGTLLIYMLETRKCYKELVTICLLIDEVSCS